MSPGLFTAAWIAGGIVLALGLLVFLLDLGGDLVDAQLRKNRERLEDERVLRLVPFDQELTVVDMRTRVRVTR